VKRKRKKRVEKRKKEKNQIFYKRKRSEKGYATKKANTLTLE